MFKVKISRKYQMLAFSVKLLNNSFEIIFYTCYHQKKVVIGGKKMKNVFRYHLIRLQGLLCFQILFQIINQTS